MTAPPTGPTPEPVVRDEGAALAEIHHAEAARTLGLLDATTLPPLASRWLIDGLDSENVRALADAGDETPSGVRLALLAEIAADAGLTFASTAEARALHAQSVITRMYTSTNLAGDVMTFSNNYTDEVTSKLSRAVARLFRRGR